MICFVCINICYKFLIIIVFHPRFICHGFTVYQHCLNNSSLISRILVSCKRNITVKILPNTYNHFSAHEKSCVSNGSCFSSFSNVLYSQSSFGHSTLMVASFHGIPPSELGSYSSVHL